MSPINPINNKDNKCFHYAVTVALNHEEVKKDPFMNKYNWKRINFSSEKGDWKKIEENNVGIALNVLYTKKNTYILLCFKI